MSRCSLATFAVAVLAAGFSGCGGSGGSGGGGGGVPGPQITAVAPSTVMERGPIPATDFAFYLFGENFTQAAQVFVDGQPSSSTSLLNSKTLKAEFVFSVSNVIGTHRLSVRDGSHVSNALPFTAYWPQQGPFVMQAIPSYFVGEDDFPSFFAMADINGDGRADVFMPGDPGKIVILYGQTDGSLAVNQTISGLAPWTLTAGDVDGNSTADLVGVSTDNPSFTCTVSTQLGDGQGNFQPTRIPGVTSRISSTAIDTRRLVRRLIGQAQMSVLRYTTFYCGASNTGTILKIDKNGSFTLLRSFVFYIDGRTVVTRRFHVLIAGQ